MSKGVITDSLTENILDSNVPRSNYNNNRQNTNTYFWYCDPFGCALLCEAFCQNCCIGCIFLR